MRFLKHEYFYLVPLMLSAIFCLKAFRQKWPKHYRLYACMVIITLVTELIAIEWPYELHTLFHSSQNNFWIYNLFIIIRFGLLCAIFYLILTRSIIKKSLPLAAIGILIIGILDYTIIHGPLQYNTYSMVITHVCIITLCLLYFQQLLQEKGAILIHKEPMVWMALSIFVYHAVSLPFLMMLGVFNINDIRLTLLFFPINEILNFFLCLCYLISFLWKPQYLQPH
jgi:hypothetical protein